MKGKTKEVLFEALDWVLFISFCAATYILCAGVSGYHWE